MKKAYYIKTDYKNENTIFKLIQILILYLKTIQTKIPIFNYYSI